MNVQKELNPPEERTQAFFSATMPNEVQKIAAECLNKYIFLVIGIVGAANKNVDQKFYRCEDKKQKFKIVRHTYIFRLQPGFRVRSSGRSSAKLDDRGLKWAIMGRLRSSEEIKAQKWTV